MYITMAFWIWMVQAHGITHLKNVHLGLLPGEISYWKTISFLRIDRSSSHYWGCLHINLSLRHKKETLNIYYRIRKSKKRPWHFKFQSGAHPCIRTPLHTCSDGEKSSVNPSHCHRDAFMVLIHVLPLKFAGLVRQVQKRDYGRDIIKRADERRDTIYWFPPCDLIEKRIAIYVHL